MMLEHVAIIGLGYVGLPLAVQAAQKGHTVTGIDLNASLNEMVNARRSPFANDDRFAAALAEVQPEALYATTSLEKIVDAEVIIICVPTPTKNNIPDLSLVRVATESIARNLKKGQLLIIESTVNPGVTRDTVLPILETTSGLRVGVDFYLAHCPERIDPGNKDFFVGNLNRVLGGITPECTDKAYAFYESIIDAEILKLNSTEEAEFVKSWENTHRNVMIAMANSAAIICDAMDMDIHNVLQGLQTKIDQFGLKLAKPGLGPGGHCIPEDIHYVIRKARQYGIDTHFLDEAAELNESMPRYAIHQLEDMVQKNGDDLGNLNVALLGLSYKENVADYRRSPSVEAAYLLMRYAGNVCAHDPYLTKDVRKPVKGLDYASSLSDALSKCNAIFIGTGHKEYQEAVTPQLLEKHGVKYVYDGRNILASQDFSNTAIIYKGIGR